MKMNVKKRVLALGLTGLFLLFGASLAFAKGKAESPRPAGDGKPTVTDSQPAQAPAPVPEVKMASARETFSQDCAACHGSTDTQYPVRGARTGYLQSGHYLNDNSYYANGGGCQKCHTSEGFVEFVKTGIVDAKAYINYPSQPGCFTCHTSHDTWDFALRTVKPVKLANGTEFDLGEGNLCANCHQARIVASKEVKTMKVTDVRPTWGAHHGPQSDLLWGTNGYEYPGQSYSSSVHKDVVQDGCVTCHMNLPEGRYALSKEVGGHSFNIAGEVHEAELLNLAACSTCHADIKQVKGRAVFDIKAAADYDQDGAVEPLQLEVEGLLQKFVNTKGTGIMQAMSPPMFKKDAKGVFATAGADWAGAKSGEWTAAQIGALYNYKMVLEDRSLGVHNSTYTVQLLYDSLQALDSTFDASGRPQ